MSAPIGHTHLTRMDPQAQSQPGFMPPRPRSPARGILVGLAISAMLWAGIAFVVISLVR